MGCPILSYTCCDQEPALSDRPKCGVEWVGTLTPCARQVLQGLPLTDQRDQLGLNLPLLNFQSPERHWQLEPPRPSAPGIEVEHSILRFLFGNMAVAIDYCGESCCLRLDIEPV